MPKINVWESDDTLTQYSQEISNAVYIPGFANPSSSSGVGIKYRNLQLLQSTNDLIKYVGNGVQFRGKQYYSEIGPVEATGTRTFWPAAAVPDNTTVMFEADMVDPSWTLAYNLLSAGIPVYYDRVNSVDFIEKKDPLTTGEVFTCRMDSSETPTWPAVPTWQVQSGRWTVFTPYIDLTGIQPGTTIPDLSYCVFYAVSTGELSGYYVPASASLTLKVNEAGDGLEVATCAYVNTASIRTPYHFMGGDTTLGITSRFVASDDNDILDKSINKIKYMTTGGYPVLEVGHFSNSILSKLIGLTAPGSTGTRDDVIVLVDHVINTDRDLTGDNSVYGTLNPSTTNSWTPTPAPQVAVFTPGVVMGGNMYPGSFGYLMTMAESVKTNPNWLAIAGTKRGVATSISGLATNKKMTRAIAELYSTPAGEGIVTANAYTTVRGTGLTIWGNRTMVKASPTREQASEFLNMRSLICEIKKRTYTACEQLMFEQNSDVLWINFKSKITPLLDQMVTSNGISGYKIIKQELDDTTGEAVKKSKLKAVIKVFPIYAVEEFDICVKLTNEDAEVTEG